MEIDSKKFIDIMKANFDFEIVSTKLGSGVKMDCFSAFIFTSITGAGYLDDPIYPFTPKGLMKVFYNAFDYKFVTGLFDNTTLKNTPYQLSRAKKYLFDADKIIIPIEFENEVELQEKLSNFVQKIEGEKTTNYIIQRIEKSKRGNGMEPFLEYLTSEIFKNQGYIVETQIPLSHSGGSPDFGGYKINALTELKRPINRAHLIELSLIRLGLKKSKFIPTASNSIIVGEAKTNTPIMARQLDKYLKTKIFNEGFEIHPKKSEPSKDYFGLVTLDKNDKVVVIKRKSKKELFSESKQREYILWLSNYIKYYLIANLTNDEFNDFYNDKTKKKIFSITDIVDFVNSLSYKEILTKIMEVSDVAIKR